MGIQATVMAVGEISDEQIVAAEGYLRERRWAFYGGEPFLEREKHHSDQVTFQRLSSRYTPFYRRGEWPYIHAVILAMRTAFPHCTILYGGDWEFMEEATDELLAEYWQSWLE